MRDGHGGLLASIGELLLLGAPAFEVALDHFTFGARTAEREPCSICMTFALEMRDLAADLFGE